MMLDRLGNTLEIGNYIVLSYSNMLTYSICKIKAIEYDNLILNNEYGTEFKFNSTYNRSVIPNADESDVVLDCLKINITNNFFIEKLQLNIDKYERIVLQNNVKKLEEIKHKKELQKTQKPGDIVRSGSKLFLYLNNHNKMFNYIEVSNHYKYIDEYNSIYFNISSTYALDKLKVISMRQLKVISSILYSNYTLEQIKQNTITIYNSQRRFVNLVPNMVIIIDKIITDINTITNTIIT